MGTRRRGGAGLAPSQVQTVAWHSDPVILQRMKVVEQLWTQPLIRIQEAVNQRLAEMTPPQPPISYETVKSDRERVLEMLRSELRSDERMLEHVASLQSTRAQAARDALSVPAGPARAPLWAIVIRCTEDLARLDGSWAKAGGLGAPPADPDHPAFGLAPAEAVAQGLISEADELAYLRVLAASSQRRPQLIEGSVVTGAPNKAPRPVKPVTDQQAANGHGPKNGRGQPQGKPPPLYPRPERSRPDDPEPEILEDFKPSPWE